MVDISVNKIPREINKRVERGVVTLLVDSEVLVVCGEEFDFSRLDVEFWYKRSRAVLTHKTATMSKKMIISRG